MPNLKPVSNCRLGTPSGTNISFHYRFMPAFRILRNEGYMAWEYNAFRNLRVPRDTFKANLAGELIDENGNTLDEYMGVKLTKTTIKNLYFYGFLKDKPEKAVVESKAGMLVNFETDKLNFDLKHPVQIECQPSYDGSVNLILNDDKNPPRLINSRFTPLENGMYKIKDRRGNNDTNIYDEDTFEIDTSLYKRIHMIPSLVFRGIVNGGACKVGNYVFYFKYEDSDGNQTDFVAESGIVSCHCGGICDVGSIKAGIKDENSNKIIQFTINDIDPAYDYVRVYYTRSTSDIDGVEIMKAYEIEFKVKVLGTSADITITGFEPQHEISINDINVQYNLISTAKTAAQCQNMLFLGNASRPDIPYGELADLSLRIYPCAVTNESIGNVDPNYVDTTNGFEYYNAKNIYYKLGYWNEEIYKLGIYYILNDYTLSPVFPIRGRNELPIHENVSNQLWNEDYTPIPVYTSNQDVPNSDGSKSRNKIIVDENNYSIIDSEGREGTKSLENAAGVIRILRQQGNPAQYTGEGTNATTTPIGLSIMFDPEALRELKKYVKGFCIVRQKRIPTILAQAFTIGLDLSSYTPVLRAKWSDDKPKWLSERFLDDNRELVHDFNKRLFNYPDKPKIKNIAAICPEAEINLPYFNQLFTGGKFTVSETTIKPNQYDEEGTLLTQDDIDERNFYVKGYEDNFSNEYNNYNFSECKVTLVEDDCPLMSSGTQKFAGRSGSAEEAWRLRYLNNEDIETKSTNLIRGSFGTYIGLEGFQDKFGKIVNIYIPGYDIIRIPEYFKIRYNDKSSYYPITDRIDIQSYKEDSVGYRIQAYRGDCFICNATHRMHRNFQDPEAPNNDVIVNSSSWKDSYDVSSKESNEKINRGDVNAVRIGHWITFKLCSNVNLSMRTTDDSHYEESGLTGMPRHFYPLYGRSITGESKIPESSVMNGGINSTTGDKNYFLLPDVPFIKNEFDTRILYSDIHISDSFRNGYRIFRLNHFRDYSSQYGGLTKLVEFQGTLIAIFEHAVALIPVNERALAGEGQGGEVFINTSNVLPENPKMLDTNFGTQWIESVTVTPYYVYGVDTVAKKIWRTNGNSFEVISDFKIQQFLNRNITLKERDKTPLIGVRNVSTHYNAFKKDIMFTFYDNYYGLEERAWNICFNELLGKWITFYSWIPSYSASIDNIFFSFDRDSSKAYSKLAVCTKGGNSADGIILSNPYEGNDWKLSITNRDLPEEIINNGISYYLDKDPRGFHRYFQINGKDVLHYKGGLPSDTLVAYLNIRAELSYDYVPEDDNLAQYINGWRDNLTANAGYYQNTVAVAVGDLTKITTDFWKHGQSGIIDIKDKLKPCFWYGKQHPFEFEFVVVDNPGIHKVFNNLYIIANKAKPESFHYEIVGEVYDFAKDKKNAYYRQEATKKLYQNLGCDILYDRSYKETPISRNAKSTMFPWYYERIDTFDQIYDSYQMATSKYNRDYQNITGSEIVHEPLLDEYRISVHQKANDIVEVGRLRGNMQYKEDIWNVEIRPMYFVQRNETWESVPPIILNNLPEITATKITTDDLPTNYDITDIENTPDDELIYTGWTDRKETRIRDKYCKIKVRYSGEDLAIITALKVIYTMSFS